MFDHRASRIRKLCEKRNPPSYEDKVCNCAYPSCDANLDGGCDRLENILHEIDMVDSK